MSDTKVSQQRITDLRRRLADLEGEVAALRAENDVLRLGTPAATTEFAGRTAHELNNMLQTIGGMAELLLDEESIPLRTKALCQSILGEVASVAELTKQLLALSKPERAAEFPAAASESAVAREDSRHKRALIPGRILVAEDQRAVQDLVRTVLSNAGHQVTVVASGAEAIAAIGQSNFDLVLMDMQMPVMDGLSAARKIRQLTGARSRIPIVAASGAAAGDTAKLFAEAGIDDCISKPFSFLALIRKIDFWLDRSRNQVEADEATCSDAEKTFLAELDSLMGRAWVEHALTGFIEKIDELFSAGGVNVTLDRERLASRAHALVSLAGLLGFSDLSQRCSALEEAARSEHDIVSPWTGATAVATQVRRKVVELLNGH